VGVSVLACRGEGGSWLHILRAAGDLFEYQSICAGLLGDGRGGWTCRLTRYYEARCGWAMVAVGSSQLGSQLGYRGQPSNPPESCCPMEPRDRTRCRLPNRDRGSGTADGIAAAASCALTGRALTFGLTGIRWAACRPVCTATSVARRAVHAHQVTGREDRWLAIRRPVRHRLGSGVRPGCGVRAGCLAEQGGTVGTYWFIDAASRGRPWPEDWITVRYPVLRSPRPSRANPRVFTAKDP
jgi:hypothetical protein